MKLLPRSDLPKRRDPLSRAILVPNLKLAGNGGLQCHNAYHQPPMPLAGWLAGWVLFGHFPPQAPSRVGSLQLSEPDMYVSTTIHMPATTYMTTNQPCRVLRLCTVFEFLSEYQNMTGRFSVICLLTRGAAGSPPSPTALLIR